MYISIFGMGYVGAVSAACLANDGHHVIGVDPNQTKVDLINGGKSPIIEQDIEGLIQKAVDNHMLHAEINSHDAVMNTELSFITVGTPSQLNGSLDLGFVRNVCLDIGQALRHKKAFHVVVVRSTMLPGSVRKVLIPTLEKASGKTAGIDFGVCVHPEFMREGSAVADYIHPPKTVIGASDQRSGDVLLRIYNNIQGPVIRTDIETAEMVKYSDNVWHGVKVAFANEIGNLCKALGIDSHAVMDVFCQDTKLNLSSYYLRPGFAFGGSCLPKDIRALTYQGKMLDLDLPLMNAILVSNEKQIKIALRMIAGKGMKKIGILGFSFKAGTDDLRESPLVNVIENLLGKGYQIRLYDKNVRLAMLTGANRDYIINHIPHISNLMVDTVEELLAFGETIVIGNAASEFSETLLQLKPGQDMVDLVRITQETSAGSYEGICW